ncbi:GAP family protein [Kribbella sp. NPDC000426]|uniref:GAP family protein n=1 Tax=Kribbella sp. NPDC000426 TaxID=3154255 RepID=UPI00332DF9B6
MNGVIGQLLPLAIGVAISPIPIIAAILMLLAPKAGRTSVGFVIGWVAGIAVASGVFTALANAGFGGSGEPSAAVSWIKIGLGVLLLFVAFRQWRGRPKPGTTAALPGWMSAMDSFTLPKAAGLGFVLAAVNPKNLLLCAAAGTAIGSGGLSTGGDVLAVAVYTVIAASTVAVPVLGYAVARDRLRKPLDELKQWLQFHNAAVMSVLLLVIGVDLIGKGISNL